MQRLALTRLLYFSDEVLYSLLHSVISKTSLDEAFFWLGEAYYSGYQEELLRHLWRMYYDFYAVTYPKYEGKLSRLTEQWHKRKDPEDLSPLAYIVNMLFFSKATPVVFLMRIAAKESPHSIYTHKPPPWLAALGLARRERQLVRSIDEGNDANVAFYLTRKGDRTRQYEAVKTYFAERHSMPLSRGSSLENIPYDDKGHIILALVSHLRENADRVRRNRIFRKLEAGAVEKLVKFHSTKVAPPRKTLPTKRLYTISPLVRCFKLLQDAECAERSISPQELLWYHWEFFALRSPLWAKRFAACGGTADEEGMGIVFPDDDSEERFYEEYNYEPDEQSKEVQQRGLVTSGGSPALLEGWVSSRFDREIRLEQCPAY